MKIRKSFAILAASLLFASCGQQETLQSNDLEAQVINGTRSAQGARPYQVALLMGGRQGCGGTIISENWVLTAAHCLGNGRLTVRAGSLNASSGGQTVSVARAIKHPNFRGVQQGYDIAVLKLAQPLKFNANVQPAALPTRATENQYAKTGSTLVISGWGMTRGGDTKSNSRILLEAPLPVISNQACGQQLRARITNGMICGNKNSRGQTGCHGDSGGPFVGKANGKNYVFGAVSWGTPRVCNKATVFARVSEYQPWITQKTGVQPDGGGGGNPGNPGRPGQPPARPNPGRPGQPPARPNPGRPGQPPARPNPGRPGHPGGRPGWPGRPGHPGGRPGWPGRPGHPGGRPGWPGRPGHPGGRPGGRPGCPGGVCPGRPGGRPGCPGGVCPGRPGGRPGGCPGGVCPGRP